MKEGDTAYHCGGTSYKHKFCRNQNALGVELCSRKNAAGHYYFKNATVDRALELVRELMDKYNVSIENVLRHYDVTGKNCPAPFVENPEQWTHFKKRLEEDEMEKEIKIKLNGKTKTVRAISKGGHNYVKVQDLRDNYINIDYDGVPIVSVNKSK